MKYLKMWQLLIKNIFFTILQPGTVTVALPLYLVKKYGLDFFDIQYLTSSFSLIFLIAGLFTYLLCIIAFIQHGKGTLSPLSPTKALITTGIYNYSRNPMYLSILTILIYECLIFNLKALLFYTFCIFVIFNLFIIFFEEPRLLKAFGADYLVYKKSVRRWI